MTGYFNATVDILLEGLNKLEDIILNKPLVSITFPSSGFFSLFIPNDIMSVATELNPAIYFIEVATPYLKFLFLILTLILSVISVILQFRKLRSKNKDKENE